MAQVTVTVPTDWKTTLFGALTALGVYLQGVTSPSWLSTVGQALVIAGPVLLGIFAKDSTSTPATPATPAP